MLEPLEGPVYDEPECQVEGLGFVLSPGMRSDVATWKDLCACGGVRQWAGTKEKAGVGPEQRVSMGTGLGHGSGKGE